MGLPDDEKDVKTSYELLTKEFKIKAKTRKEINRLD